jgi:hypothetical protein
MSSHRSTTAPAIDEILRQFEQVAAEAEAIVEPLREDQFAWRPAPDAWSIGECFDHLNAAAKMYLPELDAGIADGIRRQAFGAGPFRYSLKDRLLVRLSEPPSIVRVRSPHSFLPATGRSRDEVLAARRHLHAQFVERVRLARGLDLARVHVRSPVSTWLRFSLGTAFALIAAHERRHLWQARTILEKLKQA